MAKFGVAVEFVDLTDLDAWKNAIKPETKLLFVESPSNPLAEVADIQALADIAHANDALLAIDNSFCTPVLQQPLKFGADLVVYSATKYLDGQAVHSVALWQVTINCLKKSSVMYVPLVLL